MFENTANQNAESFEAMCQEAYELMRQGRHIQSAQILEQITQKCKANFIIDCAGQNVTENDQVYKDFLTGDLYKFQMEMKQKHDFFKQEILEKRNQWTRVEEQKEKL